MDSSNQRPISAMGKKMRSVRPFIGYCGVLFTGLCVIVLILAMTGVAPSLNHQFVHQSGIRWLAEGAVGGMLLAAFGFWSTD